MPRNPRNSEEPRNCCSMLKNSLASLLLIAAAACARQPAPATVPPAPVAQSVRDADSFANTDAVRVTHLALDLDVDFAKKQLAGTATLDLDNFGRTSWLVLDSRDLTIRSVKLDDGTAATFAIGESKPAHGAPLTIGIKPTTRQVTIAYVTSPDAPALQWLEPEQTSGKKSPFLLSQSESILARSWVPIQDTPSVRFTYDATVRVPKDLLALMSAENPMQRNATGVYTFRMTNPIPSYLLAIAVGDIEFRALGPNSGVYAEPSVVDAAAREFSDLPKMITATEELYGPYRWGRYDALVLPPSFPFGGMENPRLTFLTPTIIAGDKSLVSVVTHELAHSWSGNLVTNATWNDFWLNEGFTTYIEQRIVEKLYGTQFADMQWELARTGIRKEFQTSEPRSQWLKLDLAGGDPDDAPSATVYDKGSLFLRKIEETVGREAFDRFLRSYFDTFAFQPMTTERFLEYLRANLLSNVPGAEQKIDVNAWVYGPGIPPNEPVIQSAAFTRVEEQSKRFLAGGPASAIDASAWSTQEWVHFIQSLPSTLGAARAAELDRTFHLSDRRNFEVLEAWLEKAIENEYWGADAAIERFVLAQGRARYVRPIYQKLMATEHGRAFIARVYPVARPGYHPIVQAMLDKIVNPGDAKAAQ